MHLIPTVQERKVALATVLLCRERGHCRSLFPFSLDLDVSIVPLRGYLIPSSTKQERGGGVVGQMFPCLG